MGSRLEREDGAVAVIVAIFVAFAVLGLAAMSIDVGSLWSSQRAKVTDTDAMALAGAQTLSTFPECSESQSSPQYQAVYATVVQVGASNHVAEEEIEEVEIRCQGQRRIVEVRAREASEGWFSGDDDLSALGVTSAVHHRALFSGLAFCERFMPEDLDPILGQEDLEQQGPIWQVGDPVPDEAVELPYKANFSGQLSEAEQEMEDKLCPPDKQGVGQLPGGWGWLQEAEWDPDEPAPCEPGSEPEWCQSDPGNNPINNGDFQVERGDTFNFPVFDEAQGQGQQGEFRLVGIGQGTLVGCSRNPNNDLEEDAPFEEECKGNPDYLTVIWTGYTEIEDVDLTELVNPPPRICGVRTNNGVCL